MNNEELLSYKEAADLFKRGQSWIYALRRLGLPTYGGRIKTEEILEFVKLHPSPEMELRKRIEKERRKEKRAIVRKNRKK